MIRLGEEKDISRVNELRKQVNDMHVQGEPNIFKPGFCQEMQDYLKQFVNSDDKCFIVYEQDSYIVGYAMLEFITKPENAYRYQLQFVEVSELGVDDACRSSGIGKQLFDYIIDIAKNRGYENIELNMWTFNERALKFYEKQGLKTYRRHMRIKI